METQSSNSAPIEVDYEEQDRIFSHLLDGQKSKDDKSCDRKDHTKDISGQVAEGDELPSQILICEVSKYAMESNLKADVVPPRDLTQVNHAINHGGSVLLTGFAKSKLSREMFGSFLFTSALTKARRSEV